MGGKWGTYVKPKKSKQQIALERRREFGVKYFTPIDELVSLAASAKVKVKRLPYVPPEDPAVAAARTDPGASVTGPCQTWVDGHRRWREAGRPRGKVAAAEPAKRRLLSYGSRGEKAVKAKNFVKADKPVKPAKAKPDRRRRGSERDSVCTSSTTCPVPPGRPLRHLHVP